METLNCVEVEGDVLDMDVERLGGSGVGDGWVESVTGSGVYGGDSRRENKSGHRGGGGEGEKKEFGFVSRHEKPVSFGQCSGGDQNCGKEESILADLDSEYQINQINAIP